MIDLKERPPGPWATGYRRSYRSEWVCVWIAGMAVMLGLAGIQLAKVRLPDTPVAAVRLQ